MTKIISGESRSQITVRRVGEAVKKLAAGMIPVPHLRRSKVLSVLYPGLTAGPTHCRLFEAGLVVIRHLVLRSAAYANQARSAGSA